MYISDQTYLNWQKKLSDNKFFRRFWVFWGIYSVLICAAIGLYFLSWHRGWVIASVAVIAVLINRYIICELIGYFYKNPHPYQRLNFEVITSYLFSFKDKKPDSWPSQHASAAMSVAVVFFYYSLPLGLVAGLVALIMGVGRVILGYHDVYDIVAGWIIGLLSGLIIVHWLIPLLFTR